MTLTSSEYIEQQRREYSLYVLQSRAIPYASDGLKAAARRVLWTAHDGKKYKSATLAGATMPIHPHQSPEGTVNTLAAPYTNNIPLLDGIGAFGTLLKPTAYGAARYTSVAVSEFTKDVIFKDIEIIPMQDNYDGTLPEPVHFLPLIPVALLNPQSGIAVGFAADILPRDLSSIIDDQLKVLSGKMITQEPRPVLTSINQQAVGLKDESKWIFQGSFERINSTTIRITNLPYGELHEKYIEKKLSPLEENGTIIDIADKSKDKYDIIVKFKRNVLSQLSDDKIIDLLSLQKPTSENLNVIDFDGERVWSTNYIELVTNFTRWRLKWYKTRYERLARLLEVDIQKYKDVLIAIKKNLGSIARKTQSRSELKSLIEAFKIVHIDYIADLPVYRFTEQEKEKTEQKLKDAEDLLKAYYHLIKSEDARVTVYVDELRKIKTNYKKGSYSPK